MARETGVRARGGRTRDGRARGGPGRSRAAGVALAGAGLLAAGLLALPRQAPAGAGPPLPGRFAGVNLAGAEFGAKHLPGRYGYDYSYPDAEVVAPFAADGFTAIRLPFRWERMQHRPMGELDRDELARLDRALAAMSGPRVVILDVHNYARRDGQRLDRPPAAPDWLPDLWTRLARRYRDRPQVAFGIMNEPHGISATDWRAIAERTVAAIRGTGARNLVLVPGTRWTGAHSWTRGVGVGGLESNAAAMTGFRDPGNNFAFELHQYLDVDSSGTHEECVDPAAGARRLAAATRWLRQERVRGVLAEFGTKPDAGCLAALDALLDAVDASPDVWLGWTYWAAGGRWGRYALNIQPRDGVARPQTAVLLRHLPGRGRGRPAVR